MPEFKAGTREEVRSGAAQYTNTATFISEGSPAPVVMSGIYTDVGATQKTITSTGYGGIIRDKKVWSGGTRIYHRTVLYPTKDSSGRVTGGKRVVYIEKDGRYQPAAVSNDGGQTYVFSDPQFPTMEGVAGTGLQKELNAKDGRIRGHIDHSIVQKVKNDPAFTVSDRSNVVESQRNYEESLREEPEEPEKPVQPTEPGGALPPDGGDKPVEPKPIQQANIQDKRATRNEFPGGKNTPPLSYPQSLRTSKQDKIQFNMVKYQPSGLDSDRFGAKGRPEEAEQEVIGRVFLPIPAGITDTTGATWGDGEITAIQSALAQIAIGGIQGGAGTALEETFKQIGKITGSANVENRADVKTALTNEIAGSAAGIQGLLTRTTGAVLNPNLELLFSKPTLRPFNFTFKLSARNDAEARDIIKIIRFFKQGMAPIRSESNLFIKAPHTFRIKYIHNNKDHPFLNTFKECALKNLTVNYTPEGNYATFRDGKMVSYQLTMSFQELEPVFNDDYPVDNDASIGF